MLARRPFPNAARPDLERIAEPGVLGAEGSERLVEHGVGDERLRQDAQARLAPEADVVGDARDFVDPGEDALDLEIEGLAFRRWDETSPGPDEQAQTQFLLEHGD